MCFGSISALWNNTVSLIGRSYDKISGNLIIRNSLGKTLCKRNGTAAIPKSCRAFIPSTQPNENKTSFQFKIVRLHNGQTAIFLSFSLHITNQRKLSRFKN